MSPKNRPRGYCDARSAKIEDRHQQRLGSNPRSKSQAKIADRVAGARRRLRGRGHVPAAEAYRALLYCDEHTERARDALRLGDIDEARRHLARLRGLSAMASDLIADRRGAS